VSGGSAHWTEIRAGESLSSVVRTTQRSAISFPLEHGFQYAPLGFLLWSMAGAHLLIGRLHGSPAIILDIGNVQRPKFLPRNSHQLVTIIEIYIVLLTMPTQEKLMRGGGEHTGRTLNGKPTVLAASLPGTDCPNTPPPRFLQHAHPPSNIQWGILNMVLGAHLAQRRPPRV
jgi:hypothetical protein